MTKKYKWLGALSGSGLIFILLVGAFYWVLVSGKANGWIRDYLIDELSSQLALPCHIGHIEGNPFGHYRLLDVQVGDVFSADTIGVRYKPVFAYRVVIDSLLLKGVKVKVPTSNNNEPLTDFSTLQSLVPFEIAHLVVDRGHVKLADETELSDMSFGGGLSASGDEFKLIVSRYQSQQFDPPLVISNLSGIGILDGGALALKDVVLTLPHSRILISGKMDDLVRPQFDLAFQAHPLSLKDFYTWLPSSVPDLSLDIDGMLRGGLTSATAEVTVQLDSTMTKFSLNGSLAPLDIRVDAQALMKNFGSKMFLKEEMDVRADGNLNVVVYVDSLGVNTASADAQFTRLVVDDIIQNETNIKLLFDAGDISGEMASVGALGKLDLQGHYHLNKKTGQARFAFQTLNVVLLPDVPPELGKMSGQVSVVIDSVWHGQLHLASAQYDSKALQNLKTVFQYQNHHLEIQNFAVDLPEFETKITGDGEVVLAGPYPVVTAHLQGSTALQKMLKRTTLGDRFDFDSKIQAEMGDVVTGEIVVLGALSNFQGGLDSLKLESRLTGIEDVGIMADLWGESGRVGVAGKVLDGQGLDLNLKGNLDNLNRLSHLSGYAIESDSLTFSATIGGSIVAPKVRFDVSLIEGVAETIPIQNLTLSGQWAYPDSGSISVRVGTLSWGDRTLDHVFLDATQQGFNTEFLFGSNANLDDKIYLWGQIGSEENTIRLVVDSLHVQASHVALSNRGPLKGMYDPSRGFHIDHFELAGPAGRLIARDHPDLRSAIEVVLEDIDLRPWAFLFGQPHIGGILNAEFAFSGELSDPLIFAEGQMKQVDVYGLQIPSITSNFSYGDKRVLVDVVVTPTQGKPISLSGAVPVQGEESVQLNLRSDGFALALLDTFVTDLNDLAGDLAVDLQVGGTVNDPTYQGHLKLKQGKVNHSSIGRVYEPILADIQINQDHVVVDSLVIGKDGQMLSLVGYVNIREGHVDDFDVQVNVLHFQPIRWPEVSAEMSGELHLNGTMNRPRLSGDLLVQQADIRLGDLMNAPSTGWENLPVIQALQMNMSVRADQQVWVRDQTFNIEMAGDLDVVKDAEGFKVFGNMQSRRGNYIFQNRRLDITRGEIQFQGRSTIDPNLDIEAQTRVRARLAPADSDGNRNSEQVVVTVSVSGTVSHPEIKLSSVPQVGDGKFEEVLSVLLVGAVPSVVDGTEAGDFVLSTLANRFGQRLGGDLKLDLVEVDVAESNISRVRVGKYLTPRLFVSYAQDMGSTGREVAVEFKLLPSLTIEAKQIDSGSEDLITSQRREAIGMVWQKEW